MPRQPSANPPRRRGRPPAASQAPTAPVEDVNLYPRDADLNSLIKAKRSAKQQTSEIGGTIGEKIAKAVEEKHLDRKAFNMVCTLDALEDERLAITLPHLLHYIRVRGLMERADAQPIMPLAQEGSPALGETAGNVTRLGTAARRVAETAGEATA